MPFKNTDSKGSQPSTDGQKVFIGRNTELHFFRDKILKPKDPTYNIVSVSGQGGVGKSTLLKRFIEEARKPDFKDYCLTALIDERQTTPASMMEKFADQLPMESDFEKALRQYKEVLYKLQDERKAARAALLRKTTADFAGAVVKDVPFIGGILQEGVGAATDYLFDELRYRQMLKDAERLEDPVGDLTKAFVTELNWLTDSYVPIGSSRAKHRRRVILFFDTFERLAAEAAPWLLNSFLETDISNQVVLVIVGRDPLQQSTPADPKSWLPYLDSGTIYSIALNSFTEKDTHAYLEARGVTDLDRIDTIWKLSHGLPLYLGILTSNLQGTVDPTANVVANFLRWIPEQEHIKRQLALDAALFSKTFNQDDLEAFTYLPEQERRALYRWLIGLPFVYYQEGHHRYHEVAQDLFSRHLYQRSKKAYYAARRALADYYQQSLEKLQQEGGKEGDDSRERLELVLALAYQWFFLPDEASHLQAIEQLLNAIHNYGEQAGEIVGVLRDISKEQSTDLISPNAQRTARHLLHYLETDWGSREALTQAIATLDCWIELNSKSPAVYTQRGWTYFLLKEYQQAIADFNRTLELNADFAYAYSGRGWAYFMLKGYQRALADFDRALELDPKEGGAYNGRGTIYRQLKEYQRALSDFDRLIEGDPNNYWARFQRGQTYLWLKEIRQARADFTKSWELDSTIVSNGWMTEWTRMCQERPDSGMAERLDTIAARDPQDYWAHVCRGVAQWQRNRFEEALAEIERAIVLEPTMSGNAYFWKGMACASLGQNEEALAAIEKALALELPPVLLAPLCWFEQERPDFYQKYVVPLLAKYEEVDNSHWS